jgi:uncharacterized protein with HEPN domain
MAAIRDKISHGYAYVKLDILWGSVNVDLLVFEIFDSGIAGK